jgi:hypothetical protein
LVFEEGGEGKDAVVRPEGGRCLGLAEGEEAGGGEILIWAKGMEGDAGEEAEI